MKPRLNMRTVKALAAIILSCTAVLVMQRFYGHADLPARPSASDEHVVCIERAGSSLFYDRIEAIGTASANESVTITSNVTEKVKEICFVDGATVHAGDILVKLENSEELAQHEEAAVDLSQQKYELERTRGLWEKKVLSEKEYLNQQSTTEAAEARLATVKAKMRDRTISAPFDGVLGIRRVSQGTLVNPGTVITTLDDISVIKLEFTVPEIFMSSLKLGQDIEACCAAWPGEIFKGKLSCIDSRVNSTTRAVAVQALIPNPEKHILPGMLLTVKLFSNPRTAVSTPEKALLAYGEHQYVYVLKEDQTVEKREVRLGTRDCGHVETLEGLKDGEYVVVEGIMDLRDKAKVRVVPDTGDEKHVVSTEPSQASK